MPLLQIQTSSTSKPPSGWMRALSAELSRELGKPEAYVMLSVSRTGEMLFAGSELPCCFASLNSIGTFTPEVTERLSALLCERLAAAFEVQPAHIYIEYVDAKPHLWGHDGATFA